MLDPAWINIACVVLGAVLGIVTWRGAVNAIRIDLQEPGLAEQPEEVKQTLALLGGTL